MGAPTRFVEVLDAILAHTRAGGERSVSLARLVLTTLLVGRMLATGESFTVSSPRTVVLVLVLLSSLVSTVAVDRILRTEGTDRHSTLVGFSVCFDAVLVCVAIIALVAWPPAGYLGLQHSLSSTFVLIAIVGSALRFSAPLVITSIVMNGLALTGVLAYETRVLHRAVEIEPLLTLVILFVTVSTLALAMVIRGRQLMIEGSLSVLDTERVAHQLGTYVSTDVAERALSGEELALGGKRLPVVCLFTDIRGFTLYSETVAPEQLVTELNAYLEVMVSAAVSHGGIVDKFIGDAIMVVFGMTEPSKDDAANAIRTARAMQEALVAHNVERSARKLPLIAQGIGIHAGPAVVGNIGTKTRMQHTVMGSVVNLASRLESATKELDVDVVLSSAIVEAARASGASLPALRALPPIQVRGVRDPVAIYTFDGA